MTSQHGTSLVIRPPVERDASAMWRLAENSAVLDKNSFYCYFLLCRFFSSTCAVAESQGEVVGFASAFIPPQTANTLFLWQVAVADHMRQQGIAYAMTANILKRAPAAINTLEATISADNLPSRSLFSALARDLGSQVTRVRDFIPLHMFPFELKGHPAEILFRIGPVNSLNERLSKIAY